MTTQYDIRENDGSCGFSPTDIPAFVIWKSVDDGPWQPFSGGHSRDFCQRFIGWMIVADNNDLAGAMAMARSTSNDQLNSEDVIP